MAAKNIKEFKDNLGEDLKHLEKVPGSESLKKWYKKELFKEIVADPEYQTLKAEYLNEKRSEKAKEKLFQEAFSHAKKLNPSLTQENFRNLIEPKKESKETTESPIKKLEKERKNAAIAELERLGMKTDENVDKINDIKFENDKILIGNTPWAYEDMKWGSWTFKKETNSRYYDFSQRKAEAKKQSIALPEKKDFENTLKALPGEYSEMGWYKWWNILPIILWMSMTGCCANDGDLSSNGRYGSLGSVSEFYRDNAWDFRFAESEGMLIWDDKNNRFVCRPLVKNS